MEGPHSFSCIEKDIAFLQKAKKRLEQKGTVYVSGNVAIAHVRNRTLSPTQKNKLVTEMLQNQKSAISYAEMKELEKALRQASNDLVRTSIARKQWADAKHYSTVLLT